MTISKFIVTLESLSSCKRDYYLRAHGENARRLFLELSPLFQVSFIC